MDGFPILSSPSFTLAILLSPGCTDSLDQGFRPELDAALGHRVRRHLIGVEINSLNKFYDMDEAYLSNANLLHLTGS